MLWQPVHTVHVPQPRENSSISVSLLVTNPSRRSLSDYFCGRVIELRKYLGGEYSGIGVTLRQNELEFLIDVLREDYNQNASMTTMANFSNVPERIFNIERRLTDKKGNSFRHFVLRHTRIVSHNFKKTTGLSLAAVSLPSIIRALEGFDKLLNSWETLREGRMDGWPQWVTMPLIFYTAFKEFGPLQSVFEAIRKKEFFLKGSDSDAGDPVEVATLTAHKSDNAAQNAELLNMSEVLGIRFLVETM